MGAKHSLRNQTDLQLSYDQISALTGDQYFKIGVVEDGSNLKVYVNTQTSELLYDPKFYDGRWQSNHAVVMKLRNEGRGSNYIWQSAVIPNRNLTITKAIEKEKGDKQPPNFGVQFAATTQRTIRLIPSVKNRTHFAFSYTDAQSGLTFYLKPHLVNGVKTIVARDDKSPDAYFFFTVSPTSYNPPRQ